MPTLIGPDIKLSRDRYDEALQMQGIPCKYQYPNMAETNAQGEALIDSYSEEIETSVFFEGNPKIKTFKRLGWVVENDKNLPFLIHCSFNLPHLQRDCMFTLSGYYSGLNERRFRVTELTCDMMCPDHMIAQVVPIYDKQPVGRTEKEVSNTFNRSSHFIKHDVDYRGNPFTSKKDVGE